MEQRTPSGHALGRLLAGARVRSVRINRHGAIRRTAAMAKEDFSNIGDVIRKAGEALAETLSAVNKAVKDLAAQAGAGVDREQMVENWIRAARMAKDGMVTALEQGFQWWERQLREQVRRSASAAGGAGAEKKHANPMEAWA